MNRAVFFLLPFLCSCAATAINLPKAPDTPKGFFCWQDKEEERAFLVCKYIPADQDTSKPTLDPR